MGLVLTIGGTAKRRVVTLVSLVPYFRGNCISQQRKGEGPRVPNDSMYGKVDFGIAKHLLVYLQAPRHILLTSHLSHETS